MDVKMEDAEKMSEVREGTPVPATEAPTIGVLDSWIDSLMNCKQLSETDVQRLCEKVCGVRSTTGQSPRTLRYTC